MLLAFSPNKLHAFLVVDGWEFHGGFLVRGARLRPPDGTLRAALALRLSALPAGFARRLLEVVRLMEGRLTRTCIHAALAALALAGIAVPGRAPGWWLWPNVESILTRGLADKDGGPVPFELYKFSPEPLERLFARMRDTDRRYFLRLLFPPLWGVEALARTLTRRHAPAP